MNVWSSNENTPNPGSTYGTFGTYLRKVTELDSGDFDGFFVSASAVGSDHVLQMSAGTDVTGKTFYEFDIPLAGWSDGFADLIEGEAHRRNAQPVRTEGKMGFLDATFPTTAAHDAFADWVVNDVFKLPKDTQYEITWG